MHLTFELITSIREKKKWTQRFLDSYEMAKDALNYNSQYHKFIVAKNSSSELGYLRISYKTNYFEGSFNYDIWCASDAFVKPKYRSQGILRKLIQHSISQHEVKMIYIGPKRYSSLEEYYTSLGFVLPMQLPHIEMLYVLNSSLSKDIDNGILKPCRPCEVP
jgi:hypothetical protein